MKFKQTGKGFIVSDDVQGNFLYVAVADESGYPTFVVSGLHEERGSQIADGYMDANGLRRIADALNALAHMADYGKDFSIIDKYISMEDALHSAIK